MKMLGIGGSLRPGSFNRKLLLAAAQAVPRAVRLELWDGLDDLPAYAEQIDGDRPPPGVQALREAIDAADAVLIATPEYNASIPGALKNALDWASRPYPDNALKGKPTAVVGASTGPFGAVWAQADLRRVLKTVGARVLDTDMPVASAHHAFDETGQLRDPAQRKRLEDIVRELIDLAGGQAARAA
ncbi:MAG: NAD(P)H-dependent oxidoreductase [Chloroflexota bacterium]|nr:NAD(P)H-dependent oxidoreductase [Chloroflexota bacterium]